MTDDMMNTLRSLLGENADEKIQTALYALQGTGSPSENTVSLPSPSVPPSSPTPLPPEMPEYLSQIRGLAEKLGNANDSRSRLLISLRPYMRAERRQGIDHAIRLLNLARFSELFKYL